MAPANYLLNEPVIKALTNQFRTMLNPQIDAVNTRTTDGFKLQYPAQILDHVPLLSVLSGGGFPAIAIEDMGSTFEDDLVTSVTGLHKLAVIVFVQDPDPAGLAWKLRRYQQVIALVIQQDRTLGAAVWNIDFLGIEPGPALEARDPGQVQGYLSWFALEIQAKREEV